MNIDFFPKKFEKSELALASLISVFVVVASLCISPGIYGELDGEMKYNVTTGKINSTLKTAENTVSFLSGSWKSNLFTDAEFNHTNPGKFSAKINMMMANGTLSHKHKISHFMLTNASTEGPSKVYEGYASVSMELGPVFAIPIKIMNFQNGTISISLELFDDLTVDQAKVIDHFGNKPILGTMQSMIN